MRAQPNFIASYTHFTFYAYLDFSVCLTEIIVILPLLLINRKGSLYVYFITTRKQ